MTIVTLSRLNRAVSDVQGELEAHGFFDENLAGGNGLMLTPSIDHLFDRGFISFADEGEVLISPVADRVSLRRMGVECAKPILTGRFNGDQKHFLEYHRTQIFLKAEI